MDFFKNKINIVLLIVITALVGVVCVLIWGGGGVISLKQKNQEIKLTQAGKSEEAARETQKLIDEVAKKAEEEKVEFSQVVEIPTGNGSTTMKAVIVAPGNSPIAVDTGNVVTGQGEVANNMAEPGSQAAPLASFVVDPSRLPESTIKLSVSSDLIEPSEFRVKAGQVVSLSVTVNEAKRSHLVIFDEPILNAVRVSLNSGQTKVINFNAPLEKGIYEFYSDLYKEKGSVTKMIVE
jgi:plastocyanin